MILIIEYCFLGGKNGKCQSYSCNLVFLKGILVLGREKYFWKIILSCSVLYCVAILHPCIWNLGVFGLLNNFYVQIKNILPCKHTPKWGKLTYFCFQPPALSQSNYTAEYNVRGIWCFFITKSWLKISEFIFIIITVTVFGSNTQGNQVRSDSLFHPNDINVHHVVCRKYCK